MPELSNEVALQRQGYWRKNLQYLAILLVIWFVVSYGCAILFVDYLDQWEMSGFSLGFWYAQQGAMYVFVVLIFVYVWLMNRLDRKFAVREADDEQLAVGHIAGRHRDVGNGAEFCRGDHRHSVDSAAAGEDPGSGGGHPHTAGVGRTRFSRGLEYRKDRPFTGRCIHRRARAVRRRPCRGWGPA